MFLQKANNLPVIATDWLIGFPVGTTQGGKENTAYVLRQDSEIASRVQQDVNVLIKSWCSVNLKVEEDYVRAQGPHRAGCT